MTDLLARFRELHADLKAATATAPASETYHYACLTHVLRDCVRREEYVRSKRPPLSLPFAPVGPLYDEETPK